MATRRGSKNLVKETLVTLNNKQTFGIVVLLGVAIIAIVALILIAVTGFNTWHDTNQLTNLNNGRRRTDYNPCTKDPGLDGATWRGFDRRNGKIIDDWVCAGVNGTCQCQYDTVVDKELCIGDCVGDCNDTTDCPVLNFTTDAPAPELNCSSGACIWTLDVGANYLVNPIPPCRESSPDFIRLCMSYLDFTAGNEIIDEYCMQAIPVCEPCDNETVSTLGRCMFKLGCSLYETVAFIV